MIPNPRVAHFTDLYTDDFALDVEVDSEVRNVPVYCIWQDKLPVRLMRYVAQFWFLRWTRWYLGASIHGLENLPRKGPVILAANHRSHADTGLIIASLPFQVRKRVAAAAAKDFWFNRRLKSTLVRFFFNALAVTRRGQGARSMVSELVRYIRRGSGRALVIYPEGGRVENVEGLGELKSGFARIALVADVPVVPVAIRGTDIAMPKGAKLGFFPPGPRSTITFGKPIMPSDFAEDLRDNEVLAARKMTEALRDSMLELLGLPPEAGGNAVRRRRTRAFDQAVAEERMATAAASAVTDSDADADADPVPQS
ncbi:MAG: lysophospholipid acyltransferase family protein, partial [Planctomycetota bacterium]